MGGDQIMKTWLKSLELGLLYGLSWGNVWDDCPVQGTLEHTSDKYCDWEKWEQRKHNFAVLWIMNMQIYLCSVISKT